MDTKIDRIVDLIIEDMRSRSGFDGAWDSIDEDIQEEISAAWAAIIHKELSK